MQHNDSTEEDFPQEELQSTHIQNRMQRRGYIRAYRAIIEDCGIDAAVLYGVLEDYSRLSFRTGRDCVPLLADLAKKTTIPERSLKRALAKLKESGWIEVRKGVGARNFYTLKVEGANMASSKGPEVQLDRANMAPSYISKKEEANPLPPTGESPVSISPNLGEKTKRDHEYWNENMTALFDAAWSFYPKKIDKADAMSAWKNELGKKPLADLDFRTAFANGLAAWVKYWKEQETELQFVPSFGKWIRRERWTEAPPKGFVK
jgi:hypothetical protein